MTQKSNYDKTYNDVSHTDDGNSDDKGEHLNENEININPTIKKF